jgi:signal transduction histidine kinase
MPCPQKVESKLEIVKGIEINGHVRDEAQLEQFAGGVAHHLNNLLAIILSNCEIMIDELRDVPEEVLEIQRSANRTAEIIKRFTELQDAGNIQLKRHNIRDLVESKVAQMIAHRNPQHEIKVHVAKDVPSVWADQEKLAFAIGCGIENALESMPSNGTVEVSVTSQKHAKAYIVVSISDTGVGVAESEVGRIFDVFYTTKPPRTGMGLGLPTACRIVEAHGGFARFTTERDRGSTLELFLPTNEMGRTRK